MTLKNELLNYWREIHRAAGYVEISTPMIMSKELWKTSGHWDHYKDNMYSTIIDDEEYCVKPMNCPGGVLVYSSKPHSYRELPIRAGEIGLVHRHEMRGALHGLFRVRCFNQDDAHLFVRPDQLTDEIIGVVNLIDSVYEKFGFTYHLELSTRPEDSMGSDEDWERAEEALRVALEKLGKDYVVNEGDGAFYGPKIDFHLEDSLGRTCGQVPHLARALPGQGPARLREEPRLRALGHREARGCRHPRRPRRARREDRLQDPRGAQRRPSALHAHHRRAGGRGWQHLRP